MSTIDFEAIAQAVYPDYNDPDTPEEQRENYLAHAKQFASTYTGGKLNNLLPGAPKKHKPAKRVDDEQYINPDLGVVLAQFARSIVSGNDVEVAPDGTVHVGPLTGDDARIALNRLAYWVHSTQRDRWWKDAAGNVLDRDKPTALILMISEIIEALEAVRSKGAGLYDDKLPHRKGEEVELIDCVIRILDYLAGFGFDPGGAFVEKVWYNDSREDHKHTARALEGGKAF